MRACRGLFCCLAVAAVAGLVSTVAAVEGPDKGGSEILSTGKMRAIEAPSVGGGVASAAGFPKCESTGFEALEPICAWEAGTGLCGSTFICNSACALQPCYSVSCTPAVGPPEPDNCCVTKPHPINDWFMSASSQHCEEPHIDTVNPMNVGGQHLRFSRSADGGNPHGAVCPTGATAQPGACRQSAFTGNVSAVFPALQNPGITTTSFDVARDAAVGDGPFMEILWSNQSNSEGYVAQLIRVDVYGYVDVRDFFLAAWARLGELTPGYHHIEISQDQCNPAGVGSQTYKFDGVTEYTMAWAGVQSVEQEVWLGSNAGGANIDFDNFLVTRNLIAEPVCPSVCGDGVVSGDEECDTVPAPGDDSCCPGNCDQLTCLCNDPTNTIFDCAPRAVANGVNGPYMTDGGFFSYVADAPFTSIDTCDSDFDTEIYWNISPDCGLYQLFNDECVPGTFGGYQDPGDPNASCFQLTGYPGSSCLCAATPAGTYTFVISQYTTSGSTFIPPRCSNTTVNITKKTSCDLGGPIPGGACCSGLGDCTDGVAALACAGQYDTYSVNKLCSMVPCVAVLGACCNRAPGAGGACVVTTEAECPTSQYQGWTQGADCTEAPCAEVTGSCCNSLTGACLSDVIQSQCPPGADYSWTEGGSCSTCVARQGACCVKPDVLTAECTSTTFAQCNTLGGVWTDSTDCANVLCTPDFIPIPTVSEWGLAVLALLLLIGGKIYFSRREAAMA